MTRMGCILLLGIPLGFSAQAQAQERIEISPGVSIYASAIDGYAPTQHAYLAGMKQAMREERTGVPAPARRYGSEIERYAFEAGRQVCINCSPSRHYALTTHVPREPQSQGKALADKYAREKRVQVMLEQAGQKPTAGFWWER